MAADGWRTDHSVAETLAREPWRFEFHQALRLLELMRPGAASVGESADPRREAVQLRGEVGLAFPASELLAVEMPADSTLPAVVTARFLGLAGVQGPLPAPIAELILERLSRGDAALRDFLDIFHHRLLSLHHRARRRRRLVLDSERPGRDVLSRYLYALVGLGVRPLRRRMQVDDRAMLSFAGLLAQKPRSAIGLRQVLEEYFDIPVRIRPFVGRWYPLEADDWTYIGASGRNHSLGQKAILGTRVWDRTQSLEIELGPLTLERFRTFLPSGDAFIPLCELTQFYLGAQYDVDYRILLQGEQVPRLGLSQADVSRLGWTTWLGSHTGRAEDGAVRISGRHLTAELKQLRAPLFKEMTVEELAAVRAKMRLHHFAVNRVIIREGDKGGSLFVMRRGRAKVIGKGAGEQEVVLATIEDGEVFGEMSLISGRPRMATIVSLEPCEILELAWEDLEEVIERYPRVAGVLEDYYERRSKGPAEGSDDL